MKITVGELIRQLQDYPHDALVLLSSDEEGNSFRSLYELGDGIAVEDGYEYELYPDPDPTDDDYDEDDIYDGDDGQYAVVLW